MKRIELNEIKNTLTIEQIEFISSERNRVFYARMGDSMREIDEVQKSVIENLKTIFPTLKYFVPDFVRGTTTLILDEEE